jgi:nucleotidyltransferase substrate binding protein (TIGR01987 family)
MSLELDSLVKAINVLKRSLLVTDAHMNTVNADLRDTLKAGVIQNFEVAYEQCWKFIQRWIRENQTPEDANDPRTRKELFRIAARAGLISDPSPWFQFGEVRNLTAHTYDASQVALAYEAARSFLGHAEELLKRLEEKND